MDFDFLGASRRPWIKTVILTGIGLLIGALLGVIAYAASILFRPDVQPISWIMPPSAFPQRVESLVASTDVLFVQKAFNASSPSNIPSKTRIVLIPHHLVAAREIASLLSSIPTPKRIILLAPDHLGVGRTEVTIGNEAVSVFDATIESDSRIATRVIESVPRARGDQSAIVREISMQALYPFLAHAFPNATVTPVLMKIGQDTEARQLLAAEIGSILREQKDTLLISTVDFSHYQPEFVADFHDVLAEDVIRGLADKEVDRVELDSPGVLNVTLRVARELGLGNVSVLAHTNSLRILQSKLSQESTSHFTAAFSPGEIRPQQSSTFLFLGDLMFDREVENRIARSKQPLYPFTRLLGIEERFFKGQDAVIGNLEGPVTDIYRPPEKEIDFAFKTTIAQLLKRVGFDAVSQANNHTLDQGRDGASESKSHLEAQGIISVGDQVKSDPSVALKRITLRGMDVALIAFNTVGIAFNEREAEEVLQQSSTATHRIVYMHWGNEYEDGPSLEQSRIARWLIDHGADAVIGAHPHWMQGIETYNGKLIAYSLGNAVFDQDWSSETQFGLAIGLVLRSNESELHLFPIRIEKSEPVLLSSDQRQSRLNRLAEISDPTLHEQILSGVIRN